jgi:hypothetical protein
MGDRTADPVFSPREGIAQNEWSHYDLATKLGWVTAGGSGAKAAPTNEGQRALSASLAAFEDTLHRLAATTSGQWQGSAGDKAVAGLRTSAQNSAETAAAHTRGSTSVTSYGSSYDAMAAAVGREQAPPDTWWDDVRQFFGAQTDYSRWAEDKRNVEHRVDAALAAHESETRTALSQLTPAAPATPVINQSAARASGGIGAARRAGAIGSGGATGVPQLPGAADVQGAGTSAGGDGRSDSGGTAAGSPQIGSGQDAGLGASGHAGSGSTAGPGRTAAANVATDLPSATSPAPSAAATPYSPAPSSSSPYAPYLPPGSTPTTTWRDAVGAGPRVSTGPEFAQRLPRATFRAPGERPGAVEEGVAQRQAAAGGSRGSAAAPHGGYTPMMGGTGAGGGETTRQAKYVVPSSNPFAVPMPLHPDGVVAPLDDEW